MAYSSVLEALGQYNFVASASAMPIKMVQGETVTFVSFADAGTQTVTLSEQVDGSEGTDQPLAVIESIWKAPSTGGTWTEVTQTASASYTHADAVNDMIVITVSADNLSDGFTTVAATSGDSSILVAILSELRFLRIPERLPKLTFDSIVPPAQSFINSNAELWLSSVDLSSGMTQWDPRVGTEVAILGTTTSPEASDPTYTTGTPDRLAFDGTDDRLTINSATGLNPGDLDSQGGTFTMLVSMIWSAGNPSGRNIVIYQNSGTTQYLQMNLSGASTIRVLDRPGVAPVSTISTVTDLAAGEYVTAAFVLDGTDFSITVVRDDDAGVRTTGTRPSGTYAGLDRLSLGTLTTGSSPWAGSISDVIVAHGAWTVAQIEDVHDLLRAGAYS